MEQNVYGAKEAAALLSVKESTIRKYALLLEEAGYHFDKDPVRGRAFYDKDVIAIRRMMEGSKGADMTLKSAAHAVVMAMADTNKAPAVMDDITPDSRYIERYIEEMTDLKEAVQQQNEMISKQGKMIRQLMDQLEEERAANRENQRLLLDKLEQIGTNEEEEKEKNETIGTLTKQLEEERASNRETQRLLLERVEQLEKKGEQLEKTGKQIVRKEKNDDNASYIVDQRIFEKEESIDLRDEGVSSNLESPDIKRPFWKRLFK